MVGIEPASMTAVFCHNAADRKAETWEARLAPFARLEFDARLKEWPQRGIEVEKMAIEDQPGDPGVGFDQGKRLAQETNLSVR